VFVSVQVKSATPLEQNMLTFVKYWMPAVVWMALIFIGSTDVLSAEHTSRFLVPLLRWFDPQISWATLTALQIAIRKLGHLTEYAILAALLWRGLRGGTQWSWKMPCLLGVVLISCAIFAASDEFHQSFIASRTSSVHDIMIDICGAVIGLLICIAVSGRKTVKEKRA
jgi:VanZ family protein